MSSNYKARRMVCLLWKAAFSEDIRVMHSGNLGLKGKMIHLRLINCSDQINYGTNVVCYETEHGIYAACWGESIITSDSMNITVTLDLWGFVR